MENFKQVLNIKCVKCKSINLTFHSNLYLNVCILIKDDKKTNKNSSADNAQFVINIHVSYLNGEYYRYTHTRIYSRL